MIRNSGKGLQYDDLPEIRRKVYEEYGEFMTELHGCYVTAEDVGTDVNDMAAIFSKTRHTTCIPFSLGGSGNPSVPTARGVVRALEAAFDHKGKTLAGSTIAVQGAGHVGKLKR
jgi:glutamate dehydrogenase/leucine dehydrogenase